MGVRYDGLITPHKPGAAIAKYRLVTHGANDYEVIQAAGHDAPIIGVSTRVAATVSSPAKSDDTVEVDVVRSGVAEVEYGGVITRGDPVTSDGVGKAVKSSPGIGEKQWIAGIAEVSGINGQIGSVMLAPSQISK